MSYVWKSIAEDVADTFGNSIALAYDTLGRIASVTDAAQHTVQYSFDSSAILRPSLTRTAQLRAIFTRTVAFPVS